MQGYVQECGVRIPGKPWVPTPPGPQFCGERLRGGVIKESSNAPVTDVCGRPLPCAQPPTFTFYPICYVNTAAAPPYNTVPLPGYKLVQENANCTAQVNGIYNEDLVFNAAYAEAPCPGGCASGGDSPLAGRSGLPGIPANATNCAPISCATLLNAANFTDGVAGGFPLGNVAGLGGFVADDVTSPPLPARFNITVAANGDIGLAYDGTPGTGVTNTTVTIQSRCGSTCSFALAITVA